MSVQPDGHVLIRLDEEHGGCWNVEHFADPNQPARFTVNSPRSWTAVRVVQGERVHFYSAPDLSKVQRACLVEGDVVGVEEMQGAFVRVQFFPSGGKIKTGWLRAEDLFPIR